MGYDASVSIPITASDFVNIGSYNLKLSYDPTIITPTAITPSINLGGNFVSNISITGEISVGWYVFPGVTLPNNSLLFTIDFIKVSPGTSTLVWIDDGYSCQYNDENGNALNDIPTSDFYFDGAVTFLSMDAPYTIAPDISACQTSVINLPVKVSLFNNIGKLSLNLQYNANTMTFQSFYNDSGFPDLLISAATPGTVLVSGLAPVGGAGISLADSSILFTLYFNYSGGFTGLNWFDDGTSCEYSGPPPAYNVLNDNPQSSFYFPGSVSQLSTPGAAGIISGPLGGQVCRGQTDVAFSVNPIANATDYTWNLPSGAGITSGANTNSILVSFSDSANSGFVTVSGGNMCGYGLLSEPYELNVNSRPEIIDQPTSQAVTADTGIAKFVLVAAGSNITYQWQEYVTDWTDLSEGGYYSRVFKDTLIVSNPPLSMNGNRYRCVITGSCDPPTISDGNATLTVNNITGIWGSSNEINAPGSKNANLKIDLFANPNPFCESVKITFFNPYKGKVNLSVYNILGRMESILVENTELEGTHTLTFPSDHITTGIYFAVLTINTKTERYTRTAKLIFKP